MNKLPVLCVALTLCSNQLFGMACPVSNPNQQQLKQHSSRVQAYAQHLQQVVNPLPSYYLMAYDPNAAAAQRDNGGFRTRLNQFFGNLVFPKINLPQLHEGLYPDQGPELEQALVREVQTSIDEEARITGELKSWRYFLRRIAGVGILAQAIWWPLALAVNGIAKIMGISPMRRTDFVVGAVAGVAIGVIVQEVMHRMFCEPDCYGTINLHRMRCRIYSPLSPAMAQRLKANPQFQNNRNAAHVIDAMTTPLAH